MTVSIPSFNAYNIQNKSIFEALTHNNIHTPSSIQDIVIPSLLTSPSASQNIFYIASQNGTGKTLSYLLPIIDILKSQEVTHQGILTKPNRPRCVIFVPNKELASQLEEEGKKIAHFTKLKIFSISNAKKFMFESQKLE
jgi:superfamily II DNA/RNA helicase